MRIIIVVVPICMLRVESGSLNKCNGSDRIILKTRFEIRIKFQRCIILVGNNNTVLTKNKAVSGESKVCWYFDDCQTIYVFINYFMWRRNKKFCTRIDSKTLTVTLYVWHERNSIIYDTSVIIFLFCKTFHAKYAIYSVLGQHKTFTN